MAEARTMSNDILEQQAAQDATYGEAATMYQDFMKELGMM
jgi:hypothetical protein